MKRWMSVFGAVLLLSCISCTTATDGDGNGYDYNQTTVLGTLHLFEDVWNRCDIDTYKGLLDEGFTFYFDPRDVQHFDLPESWDYEEETAAVGNLFDELGAPNVEVALDLFGVAEPEEGVTTYTVTEIQYDVTVYDEDAEPEPTIYRAVGRLDMELTKADGTWVITKWWDRNLYRLLIETTWGLIKAQFSY